MSVLQQRYEILSSSKCGIEFEFFTEIKLKNLTKSLSKALGKKIIVPVVIKGFDEKSDGFVPSRFNAYSSVEPTATTFVLEKDFSGGEDMYELITGPMPYEESRIIIIKMSQWIKENGWTNPKSAIHLNCSFNKFKAKLKTPLINLNILKFILGFDEEFIYSRFPNRRNNFYARSINNFYPLSRFVFFEKPENIDKNDYVVPHEKYYGINFTKLPKDYLELRYLGGEGYENKTYKVLEVLDYFVTKLYSTLQGNDSYSTVEKEKLHKTLGEQKKAVVSFSDPEKFLISYPDLRLTIDMKGDIEILKSYWTVVREKLFSLIVDSGLRKGHLNLDTDVSTFQLRDAVMKKANNIENIELFDCEISGTISHSTLYRCKVKNSRMDFCKLIESNEVHDSRIAKTTIGPGNEINNCYIDNINETIEGTINAGVIRHGILGRDVHISKETLIINVSGAEKKDFDSLSDAFNGK